MVDLLDEWAPTLPPPFTPVNGRTNRTQLWQTASKRRRCTQYQMMSAQMLSG
jgi:hypothetical protein